MREKAVVSAAEGLAIDEVAPAADALADEQAGRAHVRHRAEGGFFFFRHQTMPVSSPAMTPP